MSAGVDQCRHGGCSRPRTKFSVFCDEHHQAQLRRFGLGNPPDPSAAMRKHCERQLQAYERNAITIEELCSGLFDSFIHAHTHGLAENWSAGLDSLPSPVLDSLLAYAAAHPEPRLFCPRPTDPQRRVAQEQAALAAQAALVARLQEKSR